MRLINRVLAATMLLGAVSCDIVKDPVIYAPPADVVGSEWIRTEGEGAQTNYYTLRFDIDGVGSVVCYDAEVDGNLISSETFTYTYNKPAVSILFAERGRSDGYITSKGEIYINNLPAHILQLFKVDDQGNILKDDNGYFVDSLMFWQF